MKKNFLLLVFFVSASILNAQSWVWAKASNSASSGEGFGIATDPNGNVFICGIFTSPVIAFGSSVLTAPGSTKPYLVKYDAAGNVQWSRSQSVAFTPTSGATANAVCTDKNGNSFVAGMFLGSLAFGTSIIASSGAYDTYLVKYDPSGNVLWAKSGGGTASESAISLSADTAGNCYIVGITPSTVAAWGTASLTSTGGSHGFMVKYDPAGNEVWAIRGTTTGQENCSAVSCDNSGNVFLTGTFGAPAISFGTVTLTSPTAQYYIIKFNSSGTAVWGTSSSGTSGAGPLTLSADPLGNVYLGGVCNGTNVTVGAQTYTGSVSAVFTAKYSSAGIPLWTNFETGGYSLRSMSAHSSGVFVTGNIPGPTCSIGSYSFVLASPYENIYVASYSSGGSLLYATTLPDGGDDDIDIASSGPCSAYIGGDYRRNQFTIGSSTLLNTTGGVEGIFVAKLSFSAAIGLSANTASINGAPNICLGQTATLIATGLSTYTWSNGSLVNYTYVTPTVNSTFSVNGTSACGIGTAAITITVNPLPSLSISASSNSVCAGSQVTLNASGANSYVWTGGQNNGAVYNPSTSTTYTVNGTDINNCSSTSSITILVVQYPPLGAIASPSIICAGDVATLTATGANSYTWQPTGSNTPTVLVTPNVSTTFSITKANADCANNSTVSVLVKNSPTLVLTPSASTICAGTTATLSVSGAITYSWSNFTTGALTLVSPGSTTIYSVTGTDNIGTGCSSTSTVQVTVVICEGVLENAFGAISVRIFPNPNKDLLFVELSQHHYNTRIQFLSSLGQVVFQTELTELQNAINTADFPKGVYTYIIIQNEQKKTMGRLCIE